MTYPKVRFGSLIKVQDDDGDPIKYWHTAVVTYPDDMKDFGTMKVSFKDEGWKICVINIKKLKYKVLKY